MKIHPSPTKFEIPESMFVISDENLVTISALPNYESVSVRVKGIMVCACACT